MFLKMTDIDHMIELLNNGKSKRQVAITLDISPITVDNKIAQHCAIRDNVYIKIIGKKVTLKEAIKQRDIIKEEKGTINEICCKYHISRYVYKQVIR